MTTTVRKVCFHLFLCFVSLVRASNDVCHQTFDSERSLPNNNNNMSYFATDFSNTNDINGCFCDEKKCIRKCCKFGYSLKRKECVWTDDRSGGSRNFTVPVYNETKEIERGDKARLYHLIPGLMICPEGYFYLKNNATINEFFVQWDGKLMIENVEENELPNNYCVDRTFEGELIAIVCFPPEPVDERVNSIGMIISLPCLFITFLVYFLDPNRNFHGMCLMCYVSTLFCAYVFLIILQLHSDFEMSVCTALGILCYFFFLVSFFWLNIMCIHMWRIGGQQNFSRSKKANRNRFLAYSAYAWGVPLIMTGIVVALRFSFPEESNWLPSIGIRQCWFNDDLQSLIYFYGPVTVLITINITLFAITAIKILKAKKDTAILRKDEKERKTLLQRFLHRGPIKRSIQVEGFNLYSKLVLAMGVNWAMEVISFYFRFVDHMSPKWIWYFTDFCNACYGVFIFFVYAFKKVWTICKVRYYKMTGKPYEEKTVTQSTPRTVTSNVSYATSNNAESTAMIS
ncbi:G-protein coupled receptor Mth isoform X2 [Agrilus planipennis]|uniref:G-protein coupled receptor Mth isoform X2 n=1 Tax=Agrilus planipennis TaxID=224129 RepID=A0A1W4WTI3_AGRPL|nr:G-protein coupled receptor Mth isoform X2 [Agrilus planipennis]